MEVNIYDIKLRTGTDGPLVTNDEAALLVNIAVAAERYISIMNDGASYDTELRDAKMDLEAALAFMKAVS